MGDDGLAAAKRPWDGAGAPEDAGEKPVEDALSGEQGGVGEEFLCDRTGSAYRPHLEHGIFFFSISKLDFDDFISDGILSRGSEVGDVSTGVGRKHNFVVHQSILMDKTVDVTAGNAVSYFEGGGFKVPENGAIEGRDVNTTGDEAGCAADGDALERALDAIKDGAHDAWTQFDREWLRVVGTDG